MRATAHAALAPFGAQLHLLTLLSLTLWLPVHVLVNYLEFFGETPPEPVPPAEPGAPLSCRRRERALAADDALLEQGDPRALLGEGVERDLAAGACADDDRVEALSHRPRLASSSKPTAVPVPYSRW